MESRVAKCVCKSLGTALPLEVELCWRSICKTNLFKVTRLFAHEMRRLSVVYLQFVSLLRFQHVFLGKPRGNVFVAAHLLWFLRNECIVLEIFAADLVEIQAPLICGSGWRETEVRWRII